MFRQTLPMARPAAAGVLRAAALPFSSASRLTAAAPSATDAALAAAASAAGGARR
ncbi:hypothetical protein [Streptomyces sp. WMMB 322]|uniref:hypothetical protein n=1 Tax=Streptomyces sp. WMMB 322 TaxID=1286821 RepID=UPI00131B913C|nr:hypothetical protein [Streptomyces sp. WMMB 322]